MTQRRSALDHPLPGPTPTRKRSDAANVNKQRLARGVTTPSLKIWLDRGSFHISASTSDCHSPNPLPTDSARREARGTRTGHILAASRAKSKTHIGPKLSWYEACPRQNIRNPAL